MSFIRRFHCILIVYDSDVFDLSYDSTETILRSKDYAEIYRKLEPAAMNWKTLGTFLGFTQAEMDSIEGTPMLVMQAPKSYLGQMLSQWLLWAPGDGRGSQGSATKESLCAALLQANLGQLAKQFQ